MIPDRILVTNLNIKKIEKKNRSIIALIEFEFCFVKFLIRILEFYRNFFFVIHLPCLTLVLFGFLGFEIQKYEKKDTHTVRNISIKKTELCSLSFRLKNCIPVKNNNVTYPRHIHTHTETVNHNHHHIQFSIVKMINIQPRTKQKNKP